METLEIELKFPKPAGFAGSVLALGATPRGSHIEQDHYYNAPDRDFAVTNEAFRIRSIDGECCFTYKGPRMAGAAKTRKEIEVGIVGDLAKAKSLIESLGYRFVAAVEKRRTVWKLAREEFNFTISLDEVTSVGEFVEVEVLATSEKRSQAEAKLLKLCDELLLKNQEYRSYLRMHLEGSK